MIRPFRLNSTSRIISVLAGSLLACNLSVSALAQTSADKFLPFANGAMTEGTDKPAGWSVTWRPSGKVELIRDTQTFQAPPASLSFKSVDGLAIGGISHSLEKISGPFTISGYLKSAGNLKNGQLAIQSFANGKQVGWTDVAPVKSIADWTKFSKTVELPKDAQASNMVLVIDGEGQVWLDEVTLTPVAGTTVTQPTPQVVTFTEAETLPVEVAPDNVNVRYVGRFDFTDKAGPRCAWPASTIALKFSGHDLNVKFKDTNGGRWQVEVDGVPTMKLVMRSGEHLYRVAMGLPVGEHTIRLVKATEASFGTAQVLGFQLNQGGQLLPAAALPHRLEVIGDSISAGYGNEAQAKEEHFSADTENAYFTYGAIAARRLNADYTCVAWSGKKMWPNNTIPELYGRTLPMDANSKWDFARWTPEAIVINLATNDFGSSIPDETGWTTAYKEFIARLRQTAPNAQIYCAIGPMMGDWGKGKPLTTLRGYLTRVVGDLNAAGDNKVRVIDFGIQDGNLGYGADWHPNVKNHQLMADKLVEALRKDLNW